MRKVTSRSLSDLQLITESQKMPFLCPAQSTSHPVTLRLKLGNFKTLKGKHIPMSDLQRGDQTKNPRTLMPWGHVACLGL